MTNRCGTLGNSWEVGNGYRQTTENSMRLSTWLCGGGGGGEESLAADPPFPGSNAAGGGIESGSC